MPADIVEQGSSRANPPEIAMEGGIVLDQRSVLIVDSSDEIREVFRTALERRGLRVFDAGQTESGLEMARRYQPDLIVLDLETEDARAEEISASYTAQSETDHTRLVMLGNIRKPEGGCGAEIVAKPYHYAPVIRRIEELLTTTPQRAARCA